MNSKELFIDGACFRRSLFCAFRFSGLIEDIKNAPHNNPSWEICLDYIAYILRKYNKLEYINKKGIYSSTNRPVLLTYDTGYKTEAGKQGHSIFCSDYLFIEHFELWGMIIGWEKYLNEI